MRPRSSADVRVQLRGDRLLRGVRWLCGVSCACDYLPGHGGPVSARATLVLGRDCMGDGATEADFAEWLDYARTNICDAVGFEVQLDRAACHARCNATRCVDPTATEMWSRRPTLSCGIGGARKGRATAPRSCGEQALESAAEALSSAGTKGADVRPWCITRQGLPPMAPPWQPCTMSQRTSSSITVR